MILNDFDAFNDSFQWLSRWQFNDISKALQCFQFAGWILLKGAFRKHFPPNKICTFAILHKRENIHSISNELNSLRQIRMWTTLLIELTTPLHTLETANGQGKEKFSHPPWPTRFDSIFESNLMSIWSRPQDPNSAKNRPTARRTQRPGPKEIFQTFNDHQQNGIRHILKVCFMITFLENKKV